VGILVRVEGRRRGKAGEKRGKRGSR
jgi:hypothetical protein